MMMRFASTLLYSCLVLSPVLAKRSLRTEDESLIGSAEQSQLFQEGDLCRCQASWEVVGVEAYYDYGTSVFRNGLQKVGGVFVIDSTDALCSSGSSAAADDDAVFNDDNEGVGHRRNLMGNESEIDTMQRSLQYYHQNNRRGPRAADNRRGAYPLQTGGKGGGTSTLQTGGKGGSPSTRQTGPGKGGTSTQQTGGKGGSPSTSQTGKGSGPNVEALDACLDDGPGGIPSCCFDGCRGRPRGIDQPSGTRCQTCDCDCPPIPEVFQCPFSPPPEPTIQAAVPCIMSASVQCNRIGRNGTRRSCSAIKPMKFLQCSCPSSCANKLEFLYTAKGCQGRLVAGASNCQDFGGEMPETVGVIGTIRGREFYYNDNVQKDDKITFQDGNCIKNEMSLAVVDHNDRERVLQTIDLSTSCDAEGINLGDRFGAFEFAAYTCHDGTIQNCLKNLSFEVCAVNERSSASALTLDVMELDVKGELINLISDVSSQSVAGNAASCSEDIRQISICRNKNLDFEYRAYVEGSERNIPDRLGSFGTEGSSSSSDSDSGGVQSSAADLRCSAEASARFHVEPPGLPPPVIFQETEEPTETSEPTREPRRSESPRGKGGGGGRGYRYFGRDYWRPSNIAPRGKGF